MMLPLDSLSQSFEEVDAIVQEYPKSFSNPEKLAKKINEDFDSELLKARAIYTWIASNIRYDVNEYFSKQKVYKFTYSTEEERKAIEKQLADDLARETLKKKKGVCAGYSNLFNRMCELTGLESEVIAGTSKTFPGNIGEEPGRNDHAWNAVKIDNEWYLVDATWGAGSVEYQKRKFMPKFRSIYFMTPPEKFFMNHFPENPDWLLVDKDESEFSRLPLYYPQYLETDLTIIKPGNGIISTKPGKEIEFNFQTSLEMSEMIYAFNKGKNASRIEYRKDGDSVIFTVPAPRSKSDFLTFYYKGSSLFTFKVER